MKARKLPYFTCYPGVFKENITLANLQDNIFMKKQGVDDRDLISVQKIAREASNILSQLRGALTIVKFDVIMNSSTDDGNSFHAFSSVPIPAPMLVSGTWSWVQ
ncbi:hypothetical protein SS50377_23858 [Spironucleus salmonicida]|uniref:Uncharacterized protein n=1 Tax=Spironucleus salmonicida TaxID=348837 RepID=A0A9P8LTC5_9EUKA|nr:hypothetical protein SS50377_23858 [Spironucleus salmonicida]